MESLGAVLDWASDRIEEAGVPTGRERNWAWQRRLKQRARRQLRRDYDPRRVLRILSGMDHIAEEPIVISLSGTHPWDEPVVNPWQVKPRRYRAAIRKLGVG